MSKLIRDMSVPLLLHHSDDVLLELLPVWRHRLWSHWKTSQLLSRDHVVPSTMVAYASSALDNLAIDRRHEVRDIWNESRAHRHSDSASIWLSSLFIGHPVDVNPALSQFRAPAAGFGFARATARMVATFAWPCSCICRVLSRPCTRACCTCILPCC